MKHTLSVLLQNKPGALSRVTGLFSGRGFNIESLCVAETFDPKVSCLTLVTRGNDAIIEQITKQLHKLIDVIKVTDISEGEYVEREMVLIRVKAARLLPGMGILWRRKRKERKEKLRKRRNGIEVLLKRQKR
ncbi:MAG: acetolactate synthase small subunit, partial [Candidatus Electrothrix sp. ATG2]|nr:acetolactate synthase small subunit [Candidatus Electrothrix sp. ATG2]